MDAYGSPVELTFQNKSKYQTSLGATITLLLYFALLSFVGQRTMKLISANDPFFSMTRQANDASQGPIDLWALGFMFAVENIDPRYGRITVTYHQWNRANSIATEIPIKMVDCQELAAGGAYE